MPKINSEEDKKNCLWNWIQTIQVIRRLSQPRHQRLYLWTHLLSKAKFLSFILFWVLIYWWISSYFYISVVGKNPSHVVKARTDLRDLRCVIRIRNLHANQDKNLSWLVLRKTQPIGIFLILRFTQLKYLPWLAMRLTRCESRKSEPAIMTNHHL